MSEIKFGENNTLNNTQLGDHNTMYIHNPNSLSYMTKPQWDELKDFIVKESSNHNIGSKDVQNVLECAEQQDEQGLKKILTDNSNSLLLNIAGSTISAGLLTVLRKLCGLIL